jgi:tRNA(Ile)-lysidine synthase
LVAVSGGPDSTALLRALQRLRPPDAAGRLVVGHFNHRLRGDESDGDEAFVRELAARLDLRCEIGRADTENSVVSEESAREARYAFLLKTAHEVGARWLAVAHTADDQAETILFRILRGTGLAGLCGMPRLRRLSEATTLIRPLLDARRSEVQDYLQAIGQSARIDSSNIDRRYTRNRLRYETLPQLENVFGPNVKEQLLRLGRQAEELTAPIRAQAQQLLDQAVQRTADGILLQPVPAETSRSVLREMFVELWRRENWPRGEMTFERWEELVDVYLGKIPSARMFPGRLRVEKKGESLVVTRLG